MFWGMDSYDEYGRPTVVAQNREGLRNYLVFLDKNGQGVEKRIGDRPKSFVEFCRDFFRNDSKFLYTFKTVMLYKTWAQQFGKRRGYPAESKTIDLVGRYYGKKGKPTFEAINCCFYRPGTVVGEKIIECFLKETEDEKIFHKRRLVLTTGHFTEGAKKLIDDHYGSLFITTLEDIIYGDVDCARSHMRSETVMPVLEKSVREAQDESMFASGSGLVRGDPEKPLRGQLREACGGGKIYSSLRVAGAFLDQEGGNVLFMAPSVYALKCALREWVQQTRIEFNVFVVVAQSECDKIKGNVGGASHIVDFPVISEPDGLFEALVTVQRDRPEAMNVVITTFDSASVISKAQHNSDLFAYDLVICNDAQNLTGAFLETSDEKEAKQNRHLIFSDKGILRARTLFMTSTPHVYNVNPSDIGQNDNKMIHSMDDQKLFGPVLFERSFAQAAKEKHVCPYQIVVSVINEDEVAEIPSAVIQKANKEELESLGRLVASYRALYAINQKYRKKEEEPLRRVFTLCASNDESTALSPHYVAEKSKNIIKMVTGEKRKSSHFEALAMNSGMNEAEIAALIEWFQTNPEESAEQEFEQALLNFTNSLGVSKWEIASFIKQMRGDPSEVKKLCRVLSGAECFSKGIDVFDFDGLLFLGTPAHQVDLLQLVGRTLRSAYDKEHCAIVVPVMLRQGQKMKADLEQGSKSKILGAVWPILQTVRSYDESMDKAVRESGASLPQHPSLQLFSSSQK